MAYVHALRRPLACLLLLVVLALSGCASAIKKQAYNREANAAIKRIEVLPMRPSEIRLFIVNNPGYSFGLVGALVAEANLAPKNDWLREQVRGAEFDHVAVFRERLTQALGAKGYELTWPAAPVEASGAASPRDMRGLRKSYSATARADAQLDVAFGFIGYAAAGSGDGSPYRPTVVLTARGMSADGKTVLFADHILYNAVFPGVGNGITLNADPRYAYPEFNALRAAGGQAVEGLRTAFEASADELARQF